MTTRGAVPAARVVMTPAGTHPVPVRAGAVRVRVVEAVTAVYVVSNIAGAVVARVRSAVAVGVGVAARPVRRCRRVLICVVASDAVCNSE